MSKKHVWGCKMYDANGKLITGFSVEATTPQEAARKLRDKGYETKGLSVQRISK